MSSLVPDHGSLTLAGLATLLINLLNQDAYHEGVLNVFAPGGLVGESVDLAAHETDRALVFIWQRLVRDGDGESMASVSAVPSDITQFSYMKLLVDEKTFQVQDETKVVLEHVHD